MFVMSNAQYYSFPYIWSCLPSYKYPLMYFYAACGFLLSWNEISNSSWYDNTRKADFLKCGWWWTPVQTVCLEYLLWWPEGIETMAKLIFLILINSSILFHFSCLALSTLFCLKRVSLENVVDGGGQWGGVGSDLKSDTEYFKKRMNAVCQKPSWLECFEEEKRILLCKT